MMAMDRAMRVACRRRQWVSHAVGEGTCEGEILSGLLVKEIGKKRNW